MPNLKNWLSTSLLNDILAIIINLLMIIVLKIARRITAYRQHEKLSNVMSLEKTGIFMITPLEPSERSGGGKAVKELLELFSRYFPVNLISLPRFAATISVIQKKFAILIMHAFPALNSSKQSLFAYKFIKNNISANAPVFLEFSEGAFFLIFNIRLKNFTILRDHEILLRRFEKPDSKKNGFIKKIRDQSSICFCCNVLNNIYSKVDIIIVLTNEDKKFIECHLSRFSRKVITIPVAFYSTNQFLNHDNTHVPFLEKRHAKDLLFLGNLYHRPNFDALLWFIRECAPYLEVGFTLHLCGVDGPLDDYSLVSNHIKIVRHGYVENIEEQLGWIRIGLSPIISGGGTRIKNLYMGSTGRLIVTTPLGNEGIGFCDGFEAIIKQDGYSMAVELNNLANNPERVHQIGINARHKVIKEFGPDKIWNYYSTLIFDKYCSK